MIERCSACGYAMRAYLMPNGAVFLPSKNARPAPLAPLLKTVCSERPIDEPQRAQ